MRVFTCCASLLSVAWLVHVASGADDPYGDPLPAGAKMRLGTVRYRYDTNNYAPVVLPDGKTIFARDATEIQRFDIRGGLLKGKVGGPLYEAPIAFSADGTRAVVGNTITVFETATGKTIVKLPRGIEFFDRGQPLVDLSANGKVLAVGDGKNRKDKSKPLDVIIHDVDADKEITRIVSPYTLQTFVAISADGKLLATWGSAHDPKGEDTRQNEVCFWNATTGKELSRTRILGTPVSAVEFSPDGKSVSVAGHCFIELIDPLKGSVQQTLLGRQGTIRSSAFSPDGSTLFSITGDGHVQRWRVSDGERLPTKPPPIAQVHNAGVRVIGSDQAVAFGQRGNALVVWEAVSGKLLGTQEGHFGVIQSIAVSDDSRFVYTTAFDSQTLKWDLATGKLVGTGPAQWPGQTSFSTFHVQLGPDGRKGLLSVYGGYAVHDAITGEQEYVLPIQGTNFQRVSFTPDATKIIAATSSYDAKRGPATVAVWDLAKGRRLLGIEIAGHTNVDALLTADGKRLITISRRPTEGNKADFVTMIWDMAGGQKKAEFREEADNSVPMVVAAADNASAAVVMKGKLFRLNLEDGKMTQIPLAIDSIYQRPTFSRDGTLIAILGSSSFGRPGPVVVLEWATAKTRQTYLCPDGGAKNAVFTPDGKHLITATNLGSALVWPVTP